MTHQGRHFLASDTRLWMWSIICLRGKNTRWNTTMAFSPLQLNTMCKSQPNVWTSLQSDLSGEQQQQSWTLNKKLNRHFFSEVSAMFCSPSILSVFHQKYYLGWSSGKSTNCHLSKRWSPSSILLRDTCLRQIDEFLKKSKLPINCYTFIHASEYTK